MRIVASSRTSPVPVMTRPPTMAIGAAVAGSAAMGLAGRGAGCPDAPEPTSVAAKQSNARKTFFTAHLRKAARLVDPYLVPARNRSTARVFCLFDAR